ncbi:MAG: hypothetical protein WA988_07285 [Candidatus Nanopelagicales bacterium]
MGPLVELVSKRVDLDGEGPDSFDEPEGDPGDDAVVAVQPFFGQVQILEGGQPASFGFPARVDLVKVLLGATFYAESVIMPNRAADVLLGAEFGVLCSA